MQPIAVALDEREYIVLPLSSTRLDPTSIPSTNHHRQTRALVISRAYNVILLVSVLTSILLTCFLATVYGQLNEVKKLVS